MFYSEIWLDLIFKALEKGFWCKFSTKRENVELIFRTALSHIDKITDVALRSEIGATLALGTPQPVFGYELEGKATLSKSP